MGVFFFPPPTLGTIKSVSPKEHIVFCLVAGEVKWNGKKHPGCHQIHLLVEQHHTCPAGWLGRANLRLKCFPNFSWFFSFSRQLGFRLEPVWQCLASCQGLWRLMTWKMRNAGRKTLKLWEKGSSERQPLVRCEAASGVGFGMTKAPTGLFSPSPEVSNARLETGALSTLG